MTEDAKGLSDIDLETILPKITDKQKEYLIFIGSFFQHNRYYPSRREIAEHMNVTVAAVNQTITQLGKKGYLTVEPREPRGMRLTPRALERLALIEKLEG